MSLYDALYPRALKLMFLLPPERIHEIIMFALRALDAVQATDGVPIATPANWVPGQDVIAALSLSDEQAEAKFGKVDKKLPYLRFVKQPERA